MALSQLQGSRIVRDRRIIFLEAQIRTYYDSDSHLRAIQEGNHGVSKDLICPRSDSLAAKDSRRCFLLNFRYTSVSIRSDLIKSARSLEPSDEQHGNVKHENVGDNSS